MKYIVALFGESGCGKDTIKEAILDKYSDIKPILRLTTRPMRESESQYNPYVFVDEPTLQKMVLQNIDNFLEMEKLDNCIESSGALNTWFYTTHRQHSFSDDCHCYVGCYSQEALESLCDSMLYDDEFTIIPVRVAVDDKIRLIRQLEREDNPNCLEICRRFQTDAKDYCCELSYPYYTITNNSTLEHCMKQISLIIDSEVLCTLHEHDHDHDHEHEYC